MRFPLTFTKGLLIAAAIFLFKWGGHFFAAETMEAPVFNPAVGVALAIMLLYSKKALIPILIGFFPAELLGILEEGAPFWGALPLTLAFAIKLLIAYHISVRFKLTERFFDYNKTKVLFLFLLIVAIVSVASGIICLIMNPLCYWLDHNLALLLSRMLAVFTGITLLTPLVYLSLVESADTGKLKDKAGGYALFFTLFIGAIILFTIPDTIFVFMRHMYLFALFFVIGAYLLPYSYITIALLVFLFAPIFFKTAGLYEVENHPLLLTTMGAFSVITLALVFSIKPKKDLQMEKREALEDTTQSLDHTIGYLRELLELSKDILEGDISSDIFSQKAFFITNHLFTDAEASFSYHEKDGAIEMAYAKGYPVRRVPFLYELHDADAMQTSQHIYIENPARTLASKYGETFEQLNAGDIDFKRHYFIFTFTPSHRFIVALDYDMNKPLSAALIRRMKTFAALLNKLFYKSYVSTLTVSIKEDIILTFARALELYDRYTRGHSEDVAVLATAISKHMNVLEDERDELYWAGLLHDIGKIGVDHQILNKKETLSDEEYAEIKAHVNYSHDMLKDAESLENVARMVRDHHEWWNGEGYPDGLKGEEISKGGRILSVADAIATMSSDRPYRKRRTSVEAIKKELRRYQGEQFAPDVTDAAIELLDANILEKMKNSSTRA